MSESSYVDASGGGTAPGAARNRQLIVAGLVVAIVAIAAVGYFVFVRGGSSKSGSALPPIPHRSHSAAAASGAPSATATPGALPAVYQGPPANNPFRPLVVPPTTQPPVAPASGSSSATGSPSASPTVVIPTLTPTATPKSSPTPTVTVTATPSPTGLPTAGQTITLTLVAVDSNAGTADVTVKQGSTTTPYNGLKPGQVFGTYFKLVSILSSDPASPPVTYGADFQYGDQFVQLSTGEWSQFG